MKLVTQTAMAACALWLLGCFGLLSAEAHADNSLTFSKFSGSASVDLDAVTFTFHVTPASESENVGAQLFVHSVSPDGWPMVSATQTPQGGGPKIFALYRGLDDVIQFTADLPVGKYDSEFRLLLFAAPGGQYVDFDREVYDSAKDPTHPSADLKFTVQTTQSRITAPTLVYSDYPNSEQDADGTYTVIIPAKIKFPADFTTDQNAIWAMAKGDGGFSQVYVPLSDAKQSDDPLDPYMQVPVVFQLKGVKPGLWNVNFGLFTNSWNELQWIYPGLDFEVGGDSWEAKATSKPPRVRYIGGRFVDVGGSHPVAMYASGEAFSAAKFVRGGNYGNALDWDIRPELDTPGYFVLLGDIGCRFVRCLFDPDKYLAQPMYQHALDQIVQNIWQAGEYPVIAAQDLPKGATLQARIDGGEDICRDLATKYAGQPVWLEVVNEPHEFDTWAQWKPVAERYVKTIRGIDPNAFVIVPFESWSKDGRGAAASPITDVSVDLYDGHAYVGPAQVQSLFGSATRAGLPVMIGEYGGSPDYLDQMDHALQSMSPPPAAIAPWAFTIKGQDALPLVDSANGADIEFTPSGEAIAHAYRLWLEGKRLQ